MKIVASSVLALFEQILFELSNSTGVMSLSSGAKCKVCVYDKQIGYQLEKKKEQT